MSASTSISQIPVEDMEVKSVADDTESGNWSTLDDSENPYNWTNGRSMIVFIDFILIFLEIFSD